MEWHSIIGSAIGTSPVAALSFYWAQAAWKAKEKQETQHQNELAAKDAIIARKDELIQSLQNQRVIDLKEVMVTKVPAPTTQKWPGSKPPFSSGAE